MKLTPEHVEDAYRSVEEITGAKLPRGQAAKAGETPDHGDNGAASKSDEDDPCDFSKSEPIPEDYGIPEEEKADLRAGPKPPPEGGPARQEDKGWTEPSVLEQMLLAVLPMRRDMMPDVLSVWLCDIAHCMQCPLDFVACAAVVMISSLLGTRVRVHPKHYAPWEVSPHIWGGVVAPPGSKKTPATSEVFKLLTRLETKAADAFEEAEKAYKIEDSHHADEVKALRAALDKARKQRLAGKNTDAHQKLEAELKKQLEALLRNEPEPPTMRRFRVNDPTIEALQDAIKCCPTCILIERDELVGLLRQWEMKGHEMDRAFYLEAWTGLRPYTVMRVIRGRFTLRLL